MSQDGTWLKDQREIETIMRAEWEGKQKNQCQAETEWRRDQKYYKTELHSKTSKNKMVWRMFFVQPCHWKGNYLSGSERFIQRVLTLCSLPLSPGTTDRPSSTQSFHNALVFHINCITMYLWIYYSLRMYLTTAVKALQLDGLVHRCVLIPVNIK